MYVCILWLQNVSHTNSDVHQRRDCCNNNTQNVKIFWERVAAWFRVKQAKHQHLLIIPRIFPLSVSIAILVFCSMCCFCCCCQRLFSHLIANDEVFPAIRYRNTRDACIITRKLRRCGHRICYFILLLKLIAQTIFT